MAKKRWTLGNYELKYNPKSRNVDSKAVASVNITANGLSTISNPYYEKTMDFTIDVYAKPSYFERQPFINNFTGNALAVSERKMSGETFCLIANHIEVYDLHGIYLRQFNVNTVSGGTAVAMSVSDNHVYVYYNNQTLVAQDENNVQYAKYTYSDNDLLDVISIASLSANSIYALNKFGKIFLLSENNSENTMIYQFSDFAANKTANKSMYGAIHIVNGYIGVMKDNYKLLYFNQLFEGIHGVELDRRITKSISYGEFTRKMRFLVGSSLQGVYPDLCGIDIDMIKNQLATGAVRISDDSNISRYLAVTSSQVKRIRNKQDTRYEVTISGQIM
jgi:hypothetical protein